MTPRVAPGRAHDPAATRGALISAATRVFAERGFQGARVDEIARRSGVNKAMINYHFAGKAGLYREILAAGFGEFRRQLEPVRASRGSAEARLRGFATAMAALAASRPFFFTMVLREVTSDGSPMDDEVIGHIMSIVEIDQEIIVQGIKDGAFRDVDPLLAHLSFAGALIFVFATAPFRQRMAAAGAKRRVRARGGSAGRCPVFPSLESFAEHHHDLFTRGLSRRARTTTRRSP